MARINRKKLIFFRHVLATVGSLLLLMFITVAFSKMAFAARYVDYEKRLQDLKSDYKSLTSKSSDDSAHEHYARIRETENRAKNLVKDLEQQCKKPARVSSGSIKVTHFKNEDGESDVKVKPVISQLSQTNDLILFQVQCSEKLSQAKSYLKKLNRLSENSRPSEAKSARVKHEMKHEKKAAVSAVTIVPVEEHAVERAAASENESSSVSKDSEQPKDEEEKVLSEPAKVSMDTVRKDSLSEEDKNPFGP